jgi:hypothetical protein
MNKIFTKKLLTEKIKINTCVCFMPLIKNGDERNFCWRCNKERAYNLKWWTEHTLHEEKELNKT